MVKEYDISELKRAVVYARSVAIPALREVLVRDVSALLETELSRVEEQPSKDPQYAPAIEQLLADLLAD